MKLLESELSESQFISKNLILPDQNIIKTDVIEATYELLSTCDPQFYDWQIYSVPNRYKKRSLKGGISVSNFTNLTSYFGTLGFFAIDNDTNSLIGVSNSHVLIKDSSICSQRDPNLFIENTKNSIITQPNELVDHGSQNSIGIVKKYYPLRHSTNYVDVALTTINSGLTDSQSYNYVGLYNITGFLPFATTSEINNILSTNPELYSAGRTTGGKGEGLTKLKVYSFPVVANVGGYANGNIYTFSDLIAFYALTTDGLSYCSYPIAGGDSGSALIANIGGIKKIIGLAFAGNNYIGFACRIDRVASLMNISAWMGENVNISDSSNILNYVVSGLSDDVYIDYNGNRYWQSGLIDTKPATLDGLKDNLISIYEFNEISGTTVYDNLCAYTGYIYNGINNNATINQDGILGRCYYLNGIDSYINFNLAWGITDIPFSFSIWINIPTGGSFSLSDIGKVYSGFKFSIDQSGKTTASYCDNGKYRIYGSNLEAFTQFNNWTNITIVCGLDISEPPIITINNSKIDMFIEHSSGNLININFVGSIYGIGFTSLSNNIQYYEHYIDQFAIWNRMITPDEKTILYNYGSGLSYSEWKFTGITTTTTTTLPITTTTTTTIDPFATTTTTSTTCITVHTLSVELIVNDNLHMSNLDSICRVDNYYFTTGPSANYTIRTSGSTDTVMYLLNAQGISLAYNDDISDTDLNSQIIYNATSNTLYKIIIAGSSNTNWGSKPGSQFGTGSYGICVRTDATTTTTTTSTPISTTTTTTTTRPPSTTTTTTTTTTILTLISNLVSIYNFENNTNDTLGTYNGSSLNITYSTLTKKLDSYSAYYNGTNTYTMINSQWGLTGFPFSVGLWIYIPYTGGGTTTGNGSFSLGDFSNSANLYRGFNLNIYNNGQINVTYCNGANAGSSARYSWQCNAGSFTTFDQWVYVTVTCKTSISTPPIVTLNDTIISINYAGGTASSLVFTNTKAYINVSGLASTPVYYKSYVDQLAIWNRALTPEEKTLLYNSGNGLNYTNWFTTTTTII